MLELAGEVEARWWGAAAARGARTLTLLPARAGGEPLALGWDVVLARARGAAAALEASGIRPGEPVVLIAATGAGEVAALLGALLLGALPVPISPPTGLSGLDGWRARVARVVASTGAVAVLGGATTIDLLRETASAPLVSVDDLPPDGPPRATAAGACYVQPTSGSTGEPRAVLITHENAAANVHMIGWSSDVRADDRVCSWLPLFHDMGLVGTLLYALYWDLDLVLLPPQAFLTRPARWLDAISTHGCTLSPAPSFAFPYTAHRVRDDELAGLDLSRWRVAYCGAEPIHARAVERFTTRLASCGLARGTIFPCYGLAEATLAVTFGPVGRGLREVSLSRAALAEGRVAPPAGEGDRSDLVLNGRPLPELEVELVGDDGRPVAPDRTGAIRVRGASVTPGYWRDAEATARAKDAAGWLDTGDVGAWVEGELVVVGRRKDLIIVRGKNHAPTDLEWAALSVPGVRPGSAAAFATPDADEGTEAAVLACEVADDESDWSRGAIACAVREAVLAHTGLRLRDVVLLGPGEMPKTTSGKVQRQAMRALYLARKV